MLTFVSFESLSCGILRTTLPICQCIFNYKSFNLQDGQSHFYMPKTRPQDEIPFLNFVNTARALQIATRNLPKKLFRLQFSMGQIASRSS